MRGTDFPRCTVPKSAKQFAVHVKFSKRAFQLSDAMIVYSIPYTGRLTLRMHGRFPFFVRNGYHIDIECVTLLIKGKGWPHSNTDHHRPMHANLTWNEFEIDDSIPKISMLPGVLAIFGQKSKLECTRNFWVRAFHLWGKMTHSMSIWSKLDIARAFHLTVGRYIYIHIWFMAIHPISREFQHHGYIMPSGLMKIMLCGFIKNIFTMTSMTL